MNDPRFLSPTEAMNALALAEGSYRPKEVLEIQEEIAAKRRLAEFRFQNGGVIDEDLVHEIVELKLQLDGVYADWAKREVS